MGTMMPAILFLEQNLVSLRLNAPWQNHEYWMDLILHTAEEPHKSLVVAALSPSSFPKKYSLENF